MGDLKITGLTADASPTTDDLVATVNDPSGTPGNRKVTVSNLMNLAPVVQMLQTNYNAVSTSTTQMPFDDTIPQNTEGSEFMSQAITPNNTANTLIIEACLMVSSSIADNVVAALFQDTTANALAAATQYDDTNTGIRQLYISYSVAAGTTSSTTFKIRAGRGSTGSTLTFNGSAGGRFLGAITKSYIRVTEVRA